MKLKENEILELKKVIALKIIDTKSLKLLSYEYVLNKLEKYILTNGDVFKKVRIVVEKKGMDGTEKNKHFKNIVKFVRDELRIVYGSYLREEYFNREKFSLDDIDKLFDLHKSSFERKEFYEKIYSNIFNWYKPKKIADLACGMNPLSVTLMKKELGYMPKYFASDLAKDDMIFLEEYFKKVSCEGMGVAYDLTKLDFLKDSNFIDCDMVFLLKALDSIEEVKKNLSKDILEKIPAKHIVVSFPTKSLISKKKFKMERRNWLFNFLEKMGWEYSTFEVENELFILIDK